MRGYLPMIFTITLIAALLPAPAASTETGWTPVTPALVRPENLTAVFLTDVAALSPVDVWAVGDDGWTDSLQGLTAHWDGTGWRLVAAPDIPNFEYFLNAVDAVSPQDVWATGTGSVVAPGAGWETARPTAVMLHYDGIAWSVFPTPAPPAGTTYLLEDIDMISASDGWAVGWSAGPAYAGPANWLPLAMRWQNGQWVKVALPSVPGGNADFEGVHARAGNDVWAVGSQGDLALAMHFDGTRWSRIAIPHDGGDDTGNELRAVTAVSASEVWAVGTTCFSATEPQDITCRPLALNLSGGVWRVVPTAGDSGTHIVDVAGRSANDVWLIGYDAPIGEEANHVEHWDGVSLIAVPADPAPTASLMSGLASALQGATLIPGTGEVWAVGWHGSDAQVIRHG